MFKITHNIASRLQNVSALNTLYLTLVSKFWSFFVSVKKKSDL